MKLWKRYGLGRFGFMKSTWSGYYVICIACGEPPAVRSLKVSECM